MSDCDDSSELRPSQEPSPHHPSLSRKMRKSICKVKKSLQRMTEDAKDEDEEETSATRRLLMNVPREDLASLMDRTGFTSEEIRRLYRAFKQQCPSGVATTKDLTPTYAKLFPLGDSRRYAEIVFNTFDEDKDGLVSFSDLLTGLASIVKGSPDQKLSWIFRLYDLNGDGCITKHEMTTSVSAIYEMVRNAQVIDSAVEKHVDRLFQKMDLNRDGVITRDEFLDSCKNDQQIHSQLSIFDGFRY